MTRGISVDEQMNNYTKLLTDLVNVDVKIDEEPKMVIPVSYTHLTLPTKRIV